MVTRRSLAALCAATVALVAGAAAATVGAAPMDTASPRFGVADDTGKYAEDRGVAAAAALADLGMTVQRWTLQFDPANPTAISEAAFVDRALPAATGGGRGVIVSLFQKTGAAPDPDAFCAWAAKVAAKWPKLRRFIIGNEVNATRFWSPQKTEADPDIGPRAYTVLLGKCYDALKAVSPQIQVIGYGFAPRAVNQSSTKPLAFLRKSGDLYKASGRTKPLMDAIAVHPYPNPNAKPPPAPDKAAYQDADFFGIPQLDRVKAALFTAFNGTHQRTTATGLPIVIDEVGYQSDTAVNDQYTGDEVSPTVSDADQATYHARIAGLYHCDPDVTDVLYFGLYDEKQRNADASSGGWQAGVLRPNGDRKPAYETVKAAIAAGCTGARATWTPPSESVLLAAGDAAPPPTTVPVLDTTTLPATTTPPAAAVLLTPGEQVRAAERLLERQLLDYETSLEALPEAAHDGTAALVPLPALSSQAVEAAAHKIADGFSIFFANKTVTMPAVFWRLPLVVQDAVFVHAVTLILPVCTTRENLSWVQYDKAAGESYCVAAGGLSRAEYQWEREYSRGILELCIKATQANTEDVSCVHRSLQARRADVKPLPVVVLAEGRGTLRADARLSGTMKRLRGATPGIVQTVFVIRSKANPSKWMSIALRPTVITPSAIAKATKVWNAKVKKAKKAKAKDAKAKPAAEAKPAKTKKA